MVTKVKLKPKSKVQRNQSLLRHQQIWEYDGWDSVLCGVSVLLYRHGPCSLKRELGIQTISFTRDWNKWTVDRGKKKEKSRYGGAKQ